MKGNLGNVGYISKDMGKETKKKKEQRLVRYGKRNG